MQKVISNLLLNALKYTPPKGSITVNIRKIKDQAVITVADTGCGMAEKDLTQIFDLFYQAKNNSGNVPTGTGLGLFIAKNIIELHHGTIQVASKLGEGSQFTISLPLGQSHFTSDELVQATEESVILPQEAEQSPVPAFAEETDKSKEDIAIRYDIAKKSVDILLKKAITQSICDDETFKKIEERSIRHNDSPETRAFFRQLHERREAKKKNFFA